MILTLVVQMEFLKKETGKLAFVHHKKIVISNFTTKVCSMFEVSDIVRCIFDVQSNERTW